MIEDLRENLPQIREAMRELPAAIRSLSDQAAGGNLSMRIRSAELEALQKQLDAQQEQRFLLATGATLIIAGTLAVSLAALTLLGGGLLAAGIAAFVAARPKRKRR